MNNQNNLASHSRQHSRTQASTRTPIRTRSRGIRANAPAPVKTPQRIPLLDVNGYNPTTSVHRVGLTDNKNMEMNGASPAKSARMDRSSSENRLDTSTPSQSTLRRSTTLPPSSIMRMNSNGKRISSPSFGEKPDGRSVKKVKAEGDEPSVSAAPSGSKPQVSSALNIPTSPNKRPLGGETYDSPSKKPRPEFIQSGQQTPSAHERFRADAFPVPQALPVTPSHPNFIDLRNPPPSVKRPTVSTVKRMPFAFDITDGQLKVQPYPRAVDLETLQQGPAVTVLPLIPRTPSSTSIPAPDDMPRFPVSRHLDTNVPSTTSSPSKPRIFPSASRAQQPVLGPDDLDGILLSPQSSPTRSRTISGLQPSGSLTLGPSKIPRPTTSPNKLRASGGIFSNEPYPGPSRRTIMNADAQASLSNLSSALERLTIPRFKSAGDRRTSTVSESQAITSGVHTRSTATRGRLLTRSVSTSAATGPPQRRGGRGAIGHGPPPTAFTKHRSAGASNPRPPPEALSATAANHRVSLVSLGVDAPNVASTLAKGTEGKEGKLDVLKDCVIYVDVKTDEGADAGALFIDMLKGLGARILTRPTPSLTHIVYKSGSPTTLTKHKVFSEPKPFLVGIGWVVECVERRERVDEQRYLIKGEDAEPGFGKRRKSGQFSKVLAMGMPMEFKFEFDSEPSGSQSNDQHPPSEGQLAPLERARRGSHLFAPKISSPLKASVIDDGL